LRIAGSPKTGGLKAAALKTGCLKTSVLKTVNSKPGYTTSRRSTEDATCQTDQESELVHCAIEKLL
jgi:hypothetical protein